MTSPIQIEFSDDRVYETFGQLRNGQPFLTVDGKLYMKVDQGTSINAFSMERLVLVKFFATDMVLPRTMKITVGT